MSSRGRRAYSRSASRSRSKSPRYSRKHSRSRSRSYSPKRRGSRRSRSRSPLPPRRKYFGNREVPEENTCLGVFGLSLETTERELERQFSRFGPLSRVQVVLDGQTGQSRGFAFVYFENLEDARNAKEEMCDKDLDGRRIRVDYSLTKRPHTPTPGCYMGRRRSSRGGGGYRGGGGGYDRRDHGGYRGSGGHDRYRRSPSPYHRRDDYRRRSRSRSYSPRYQDFSRPP